MHDVDQHAKTLTLPPYRALVAVDAEKFGGNRSAELPVVNSMIQDVLRGTLTCSAAGDLWEGKIFGQTTGDGYVFATGTEVLPVLLGPWLGTLHEALSGLDPLLRMSSRDLRLRLRVSVHVGPVPDLAPEVIDPVSTPTTEVFRLLDAEPSREALRTSNPDVTFLAAVISQRAFEDVIAAGYSVLHPDEFTPVTAEIREKDFAQPAWLYLPRRSAGRPEPEPEPVSESRPEAGPGPRAAGPGSPRTSIAGNVGQSYTLDTINGGDFRPSFGAGFLGEGPSFGTDRPEKTS